ncbi:hypothetical protein [Nonomuraea sp. NPDC046570]|uniref:hypothetical protein n=1 Tax=Nonomuraea sp. NPDC046570 TaxID=3155255 RepID=UPI0033CDC0BD
MLRTVTTALAALTMAAQGTAVAETVAPGWKVVNGVTIGSPATALLDVSATGPGQAWAAGYACSAEDREGCGAIIRWNGSAWKQVKLPASFDVEHVEGISAGPAVWAVGNGTRPWAGHWNGSRWRGYTPLSTAAEDRLYDVAVSAGRPWAVGTRTGGKGVVLGWTAARGFYQAHATPGSLAAVTAGKGGIWAVGSTGDQPLILRGGASGTGWKVSPVPSIPGGKLTRVWQGAGAEAWAVGYTGAALETSKPIALRFDGTAWRQVPVPVAKGRLSGLTADSSGTVWASGVDLSRGKQVLFLRYSGGALRASYSPVVLTREQRDYDHQTVTRTSITAIPGTGGLWAVAAAGGGDREMHAVLRYG